MDRNHGSSPTEITLDSGVLDRVNDPYGKKRGLLAQLMKEVQSYAEVSRGRSRHVAWDAFQAYCQATAENPCSALALDLLASCGGTINAPAFVELTEFCTGAINRIRHLPQSDANVTDLAIAMQVRDFLRKSCIIPGGPTADERRSAALEGVLQSERAMGEANKRLHALFFGVSRRPLSTSEIEVVRCLEYCRSYIGRHLRKVDFEQLADDCTFGPGTTIGTGRSVTEKISEPGAGVSVSAALQPFAGIVLTRYFPGWAKHLAFGGLHEGNTTHEEKSGYIRFNIPAGDEKFTSVDKDWAKDRPICVPATLNGFFQSSIGREFERVAARMGNPITAQGDVDDPQSINRALALQASRDGELASVDFSEASDRVATKLVEWCFGALGYGSDPNVTNPHAVHWFKLMDLTRARTMLIGPDEYLELERFSAMGNGFTFPLMTVILTSIARFSCGEVGADPRKVRCFGDDVLLPTSAVDTFMRITEYLGMKPNRNKTFSDGFFRESCGMDAFHGVQITPFRVTFEEESIHDLDTIVSMANGLYRRSVGGSGLGSHRVGLLEARRVVLDAIPRLALNCLSSSRDLGDSNIVRGHPNQVLRNNPLIDLYWRGIGLTPVLVRQRKVVHLSKTRDWTAHKAFAGFIYYARPFPRSLAGSFQVQLDEEELVIRFAPRLSV